MIVFLILSPVLVNVDVEENFACPGGKRPEEDEGEEERGLQTKFFQI